MTRPALLVISSVSLAWLLATPSSLAPTHAAVNYECILTNTCAPPPCEFFNELKVNRAATRILRKVKAPRSRSDQAFERFSTALDKEVKKALRDGTVRYFTCGLPEAPYVMVSEAPQCEMFFDDGTGRGSVHSVDDVRRFTSGCLEAADAAYEAGKYRRDQCLSGVSNPTVAQVRALSVKEARKRVTSLQKSLLRYLSSCKPDASTADEVVKLGLSRLLRAGQRNRGAALGKWVASQNSLAAAGGGRKR
jgi:hypothetical protein